VSSDVQRSCWCGSTKATSIATFELNDGARFPLVQCTECGVQAIFPQPDEQTLASYYSREYYGSSRRKFIGPVAGIIGWFQAHRARLAARFMPAGGNVLDVGCGNGGFLINMKRLGFQVHGTEWSAQSAERVPAQQNIPVHIGDLLDLNLPPRSFDLIAMWHVLEHVRQPDATLRKIHQLLKPGGGVLLALPNVESAQARKFSTAWLHYDPPRHLHNFGVASLNRLLTITQFQTTWSSTFSFEQNVFGYIQSWLNARGVPRDRLFELLKGQSKGDASAQLHDFLWMCLLLAPAIAITTYQSLNGRGATLTVHARAI
jgi:SAM-dependent methyltransferase